MPNPFFEPFRTDIEGKMSGIKWIKCNPSLHGVLGYDYGAAWYKRNKPDSEYQLARDAMELFVTKIHNGRPIADAWVEANCDAANNANIGGPFPGTLWYHVVNAAALIREDCVEDAIGSAGTFPTKDTENQKEFIYKQCEYNGDDWEPVTSTITLP
ncbi:MAG: hypothetical protein HQ592_07065 [Planctomycetes bacterium]|nr:hypothetical protein [Planctomycetota bacterium]